MLFLAVSFTVLTAFTQNGIVVRGYVYTTDVNAIIPVEGQDVDIVLDSVNTGFFYQNTVVTDENGYFEDIVELPAGYYQGAVHVSTYDPCLGFNQQQSQFFAPGMTMPDFLFYLCNTPPPGCENFFFYFPDSTNNTTFTFEGFMMDPTLVADEYYWDFGDGTIGTGQTITHYFQPSGVAYYTVTLTTVVTGPDSISCTGVSSQEVWINGISNCKAMFTYYPDSLDGLTLNFQDMSFINNGTLPTSWSWDFGDGSTSTVQNPVHTYADSGFYYVCLTISDSSGQCFDTFCDFVTAGIIIPPPEPCMNWFDFYNDTSLTITFNGYCVSQNNVQYFWEFGDGVSATGQSVTHTYAQNGLYDVTLTTIDGDSCTWVSMMSIWVGGYSADIFGNIYLSDGILADAAIVRLMVMDTLNMGVVEVLSTTTNPQGGYVFVDITLNNYMVYFIQAELATTSQWYGQYMPTYHFSSLSWEEAWPIMPFWSWQADVLMIESDNQGSGPGSISGTLGGAGLRDGLGSIMIMLMDENGNPLTYVLTDENGQFLFTNLPYGTYQIHVEMLTVHSQQMIVTISADNPNPAVSVVVAGAEAYLDIDEPPVTITSGEIYPNPAWDNAYFEIASGNTGNSTLEVYNFSGQRIYGENVTVSSEISTVEITTSDYKPGIYLLRLTTQAGEVISKKFVKK